MYCNTKWRCTACHSFTVVLCIYDLWCHTALLKMRCWCLVIYFMLKCQLSCCCTQMSDPLFWDKHFQNTAGEYGPKFSEHCQNMMLPINDTSQKNKVQISWLNFSCRRGQVFEKFILMDLNCFLFYKVILFQWQKFYHSVFYDWTNFSNF